METRRKLVLFGSTGITVLVILILSGFFIWKQMEQNQLREDILSKLPPVPTQESNIPIIVSSIEEAYEDIAKGSDPVASLGRLAQLYQANGLLNEAIQALDLLLKLQPENPYWPHYLAFILAGYGELEVAIPLWERTIELDPDYIPAHLRRGEAFIKLNRMEDAKDAFLRVLIKDQNNPHAFHGLARVAIDRNDYQTAHEYLVKSTKISGMNVGIQLLVTVLDRLERNKEAQAIRGMARTLEGYSDIPDPWIHQLMDYCYDAYQLASGGGYAVYAGDIDRGIELMKRSILYEPDDATAHYQLGIIYKDANRASEAIPCFQKATELNPQLSDAWLHWAILFLNANHLEEGDRILIKGLSNCPTSPALHLKYGERLFAQERKREAISALKKSIELRPQEPDAYTVLARVYLSQNQYTQARDIAIKSLDAEAFNPMGVSLMVATSILLKDEAEARKWFKEAKQHPRIKAGDRNNLVNFFEEAFGKKPE